MLYRVAKFTYNLIRLVGELAVLSLVIAFGVQYTVDMPLLVSWSMVYGVLLITLSPLLLTHAYEMVELGPNDVSESIGVWLSVILFFIVAITLSSVIYIRFYL